MVDDATQDVFMVVHRRLGDYDGRTPMLRWVLGIARNVALKYRERAARAAQRLRPIEDEVEVVAPAYVTRGGLGEDALARREAAAWVERFLDGLEEGKRVVFVLCEIEGLTAPEAAELLAIKLNTVYSRLRVARHRFEQALARRRAAARRQAWSR